jgi:MFS family permease
MSSFSSQRVHAATFWLAAVAFLLNMAFSAVPTPLYVLFQQRDHFSDLMITVVYAVYAVGVIASLFLWGHLSDWHGRRRLLVPALLANVVSAVIFVSAPSLAGLMVARVISGVAVGLSIATATSYLAELHGRARPDASGRRAQVVATSANLGGIGLGPLAAGLLAQFAPWPMRLSFIVFGAALLVLAGGIALSPETVRRPDLMPPYRVQRVSVPAHSKRLFRAATGAAMASFAVLGVFNSLVPSFLLGSLHESSHALAGAVAFAAFAAFAASAVAQIVTPRTPTSKLLGWGVPIVALGLALLTGGMWNADLVMFVFGGILTGGGAGLVFKGAVSAIYRIAPLESRAETLAGFFLGAYVGLSIPVVGLGVATTYWSERNVMLVFVLITAAAIALSARSVLRGMARLDAPAPDPVVQDQAA